MKIENLSRVGAASPVNFTESQNTAAETAAPRSIAIGDALSGLASQWQNVEQQSQLVSFKIPSSIEPLIRSQLAMNKLALTTQILTKGADAVSSSLRQIQQIGGN